MGVLFNSELGSLEDNWENKGRSRKKGLVYRIIKWSSNIFLENVSGLLKQQWIFWMMHYKQMRHNLDVTITEY